MRALAIVIGVILLFPGACSLWFAVISSASDRTMLSGFWAVCFLVSAVGVTMIVLAARKPAGPKRD